MSKRLGIYLHIPFCLKKCHYCDFCSFPGADGTLADRYCDELVRRMELWREDTRTHTVDTVYFGGGTPTLLSAEQLRRLTEAVKEIFSLDPLCEITVECNPATADLQKLSAMREMGINRLSIGLQSVHDSELQRIGRAHSFGDFLETYENAKKAGFDNVSVDLMYGLPDQSLQDFRRSLATLADLRPEHISAYGLKIEEGTVFGRQRELLAPTLPDEDTELEMYLSCSEILSQAGYHRYEISNFAQTGRESRHNLRYWRGEDYLGFGVAAHSCFNGRRFGNSRDIAAFLRGEEILCEQTLLTPTDRLNEFLMLGLRLAEGIDREEFSLLFGRTPEEHYPPLPRLIKEGLMKEENGRLSFTDRGFFVSNAILAELLISD